jgi:hypothetical protein
VALVDRRPGERPGIVEFPNLFTLTGPGNLSVLTKCYRRSSTTSSGRCVGYLRRKKISRIKQILSSRERWRPLFSGNFYLSRSVQAGLMALLKRGEALG